MDILSAHAPTAFTKDARSFILFSQHLKMLEPSRSLDGNDVLHVVELFLPLEDNLSSTS
jgi:hypothetical protein